MNTRKRASNHLAEAGEPKPTEPGDRPVWARELISVTNLPIVPSLTTPLFGSMNGIEDDFEQRLREFAAEGGLRVSSSSDRQFVIEQMARSSPKRRSGKGGRPRNDRRADSSANLLVAPLPKTVAEIKAEALLDELEHWRASTVQARGDDSTVSDAAAINWKVFGKLKTSSSDRLSDPRVKSLKQKITRARKLLGRQLRPRSK